MKRCSLLTYNKISEKQYYFVILYISGKYPEFAEKSDLKQYVPKIRKLFTLSIK